jgi:hypothetical protein
MDICRPRSTNYEVTREEFEDIVNQEPCWRSNFCNGSYYYIERDRLDSRASLFGVSIYDGKWKYYIDPTIIKEI